MNMLVNCKLCGKQVASDAGHCIHCGTRDYLPDSYLSYVQNEREKKRQEELRVLEKTKGKVVGISINGRGRDLFPYRNVLIDGKNLHEYSVMGQCRLLPGRHIAELKSRDMHTSQAFFVNANTSEIVIKIKYHGGFFRTGDIIEGVEVH